MSAEEIGKLTPYQINRILFLRCDDKGQPYKPEKVPFEEVMDQRFGKMRKRRRGR
jgi:hypothetical protein